MTEPTRIGKYTIESVLGKGAMGVVYKAFDPGIERVVAIKTVRKDRVDQDLIEQSMARFKNEAKAAGRLLHPNIVSVYEYGEDDANAFIVMEYVEGTGLREYLARKASFDLPHVASIMTQLLRALDFAHERGVIHRDIKPANLILTADGTLKVADFGIARIDTSNLTTLGMVMGTPSYMSPEQCQGQAVDRRSDLFSAAVVLYELLAGEKPFAGATETIAYKICHESPRPPSTLSRLSLSPTIDAVLAVALEKSPDARFQNARAFSRALREALNAPAQQNPDETAATQINTAIAVDAAVDRRAAGLGRHGAAHRRAPARALRRTDGQGDDAQGGHADDRPGEALRPARRKHQRSGHAREIQRRNTQRGGAGRDLAGRTSPPAPTRGQC